MVAFGDMGNKYFWKLEKMGEKFVICDIDPSKEIKPYSFYCHFGDVKEELRGVVVAVDPQYHPKIAKEFLERGVPVFLEKPPAINLKDFEDIKTYKGLYISEVESYSLCIEYLKNQKST